MAKICSFSKIKLVTARKTIFKIFFQLLKVKIAYKIIYIGQYTNASEKFCKKVLN